MFPAALMCFAYAYVCIYLLHSMIGAQHEQRVVLLVSLFLCYIIHMVAIFEHNYKVRHAHHIATFSVTQGSQPVLVRRLPWLRRENLPNW